MDTRLKIIIAISIVSLVLLGITWSISSKLEQSSILEDIELAS